MVENTEYGENKLCRPTICRSYEEKKPIRQNNTNSPLINLKIDAF